MLFFLLFNTVDIWIHMVLLGEVVAAERLLLSKKKVLVTTMTPTGAAQVGILDAYLRHCLNHLL